MLPRPVRHPAVLGLLLATASGCTSCLVRTAPNKVAMGVARLTVQVPGR